MAIDREATLKTAEKFLRVGRLDAAIAEYARVVEEHPGDWNAANALGDLYIRAGQFQRAVPLYSRIADHLLTEGFYPKAAALYKKILKITPENETAQLRLAEIAARQGLLADARAYYASLEKRRRDAGDAAGADEIVVRMGTLDPEDLDARLTAVRATERRGQLADAADQYRQLYEGFLAQGREVDARGVLRDCIRCNPATRRSLLLPLARFELSDSNIDEARTFLTELAVDSEGRSSVITLAWDLLEQQPDAAACCIEAAADGAVAAGDSGGAAKLLQQYASRVPDHVPTLLKLVEVCVDGALEELVFDAQAQLADAYLATGNAAGARVIAEDLAARDPRNPIHLERLGRALKALGVEDVPAIVGALPTSADEGERRLEPASSAGDAAAPGVAAGVSRPEPINDVAAGVNRPQELSADGSRTAAPASTVEIDLTQLLGELQGQSPPPEAPPRAPRDLDQVFAEMRSEVAGADDDGVSGDHVELARTYLDMGMPQEAIGCLQIAARSPQYRFVAASMIGEIHRDEGDLRAAIEWFERAAEVPPPEPERGRVLLYDLADLLETVGEPARSLAVFLELTADAPGYRDVHDRVARLSRIETEG